MQLRLDSNEWHKTLWKVVTNPATEVAAAIVIVLLAAWVAVQTEVDERVPVAPVISGYR